MPTPFIKAMAKKHHKSEKEVEEAWENAKDIVEREYDSVGGKFGLVVKITKRILNIKESVSFVELILAEELIPFKPSKTTSFLQQWSRGDMIAASRVDDEITTELSKTVQDSTYTLYRGWKFGDHESMYEKMGFHYHDMVVGKKLKLKVEKLRSWTKSKEVAEKFTNPKYDSINERVHSDHELDEMGFDHGELLGLSVLIQVRVNAKDVFADLTNVPARFLTHAHEEQEVILKAGEYTVEIIDVQEHIHSSPKHRKAERFKEKLKLIFAVAQAMYKASPPLKTSDLDSYLQDTDGEHLEQLLDPLHAAVFLLTFGFNSIKFLDEIKSLMEHDIIRDQEDADGNIGSITRADIAYLIHYIEDDLDNEKNYSDRIQTEFSHFGTPPRSKSISDKKHEVVDLDKIDTDFEMPAGDWEPE